MADVNFVRVLQKVRKFLPECLLDIRRIIDRYASDIERSVLAILAALQGLSEWFTRRQERAFFEIRTYLLGKITPLPA